MPAVIAICLRYLTYDPNYNFDDEDEDDNAMDAEQNDEDYQGGLEAEPGSRGAGLTRVCVRRQRRRVQRRRRHELEGAAGGGQVSGRRGVHAPRDAARVLPLRLARARLPLQGSGAPPAAGVEARP